MIIIRGRNHSPQEVEDAAGTLEEIRTGCVVALSYLPEGGVGEELLILAEARQGIDQVRFPALAESCSRAVRAATGLAPDEVQILEPGTLPRTSSGKLRRRESLHRWLEGSLLPPTPVTLLTMAGAMARSLWVLARSRQGINPDG